MSSCCGGKCGCGSGCKCGTGCNGCGKYPDLTYSENFSSSQTLIIGVAPNNPSYSEAEGDVAAENGCKCGPTCSCNPCNCK